MKVSISYTVDFEDVPEEMLKMTHRALNEYENINFSDLGKALEGNPPPKNKIGRGRHPP